MQTHRRSPRTFAAAVAATFVGLLILAVLAGAQNVNVAGTWHGIWDSNLSGDSGGITTQMSQSGSSLSGTIQLTNSQCTSQVPITGNVQGDIATFNASCVGCSLAFTQGVVQSNTMNGNYTVYCGTSLYDSGTFSLTGSTTGAATEKILWTNSSYAVSISSLDSSGNQTSTMSYGPYSGWIPGSYVLNPDGTARLFWTTSAGQVSIWRLDSSNNYTGSAVYGPYSGWTPVSYRRNPDGTARIFWTSNAGQTSVWRLDSSDNYIGSAVYGPYSGWTPGIYALRPDDTARIVWTSTSGQVSVWVLDSSGNYVSSTVYGPYSGWRPASYVPRPDGTDALVWNSTSGQISIWRLNSSGNYVYSKVYPVTSGYTPVSYVPKPDGTARCIGTDSASQIGIWRLDSSDNQTSEEVYTESTGMTPSGYLPDPDDTARIAWTDSSGQIDIWHLDSSDNKTSSFVDSPVSGWTAMGYAVVGYYWPIKSLTTTTVPNVVGMSETAATAAITAAGLTVGTITTQASSSVASGNIISQSPAAGTSVSQGSSVALVVSSGSGPPIVTVPNVVGMSQSAATSAITAAGLTVGTITTQASTTVAAGNVISQSPAPGTSVSRGSAVALTVSSGPAQVTVPNVVGLSQSGATSAITAAGLKVGTITTQASSTVASGNIISQSPAAGTSVSQGSSVSLVVSSGPPMVTVPNVVGMSESSAASAIAAAGLKVNTVTYQSSSTVMGGSVISESPAAGTAVQPGSNVSFVLSDTCSQQPPDACHIYQFTSASNSCQVVDLRTPVLQYDLQTEVPRLELVSSDGRVSLYLTQNCTPWQGDWCQANEPASNYCGPTAAMNLLDWLGTPVTEATYNTLGSQMDTNNWLSGLTGFIDCTQICCVGVVVDGVCLGIPDPTCTTACTIATETFLDVGTSSSNMYKTLASWSSYGYRPFMYQNQTLAQKDIEEFLKIGEPIVVLLWNGSTLHWTLVTGTYDNNGEVWVRFANNENLSWSTFIHQWSWESMDWPVPNILNDVGLQPYTWIVYDRTFEVLGSLANKLTNGPYTYYESLNGAVVLYVANNGELILNGGNGGGPIWRSGKTGATGSYYAVMQQDGNFVVYDQNNKPLWATGTNGHPGAYLALQNDSNMVIYDQNGTTVLFSTNTVIGWWP